MVIHIYTIYYFNKIVAYSIYASAGYFHLNINIFMGEMWIYRIFHLSIRVSYMAIRQLFHHSQIAKHLEWVVCCPFPFLLLLHTILQWRLLQIDSCVVVHPVVSFRYTHKKWIFSILAHIAKVYSGRVAIYTPLISEYKPIFCMAHSYWWLSTFLNFAALTRKF